MTDGNTSNCYTCSHVTVWEVYRIFDISVFKEISDFFYSHYCTVFFRFRCGCTKMWCNEDSWSSSHKRICKVCYIFLNLTTVKSFDQSFFINKKVSCKVQKNDTLFHLCESFFVDHLTRIICQRYIDRDIITLAVDFIQRFAVFDGS